MPHVTLRDILADAKARGYAVPCLWAPGTETVLGFVAAAEERRAPLILCVNRPLCESIPLELSIPLIVGAAERARVPVATVLDHGESFEATVRAIRLGVSSVMFDGSALPYERNVEATREVVRAAHPVGVSVEAELGAVGGSAVEMGEWGSERSIHTDPDEAEDFVTRTEVDALAVSFGNVHGKYRGAPRLDLGLVRRLAARVEVPLVMHGASGLDDADYPRLISSGISKINYYTAMSLRAVAHLRDELGRREPRLGWHHVVASGIRFFERDARDLLDLLGSSGKASSPGSRGVRSGKADSRIHGHGMPATACAAPGYETPSGDQSATFSTP